MITQTNNANAKPSHRLYVVTGDGKNASWREIAAAWPHRDGNGYSINCDALPLNGKIVMRVAKERPAKQEA